MSCDDKNANLCSGFQDPDIFTPIVNEQKTTCDEIRNKQQQRLRYSVRHGLRRAVRPPGIYYEWKYDDEKYASVDVLKYWQYGESRKQKNSNADSSILLLINPGHFVVSPNFLGPIRPAKSRSGR